MQNGNAVSMWLAGVVKVRGIAGARVFLKSQRDLDPEPEFYDAALALWTKLYGGSR